MATPYVNTPVAPAQSETDRDIDVGTGNDDTWDDDNVRLDIFKTFIDSGRHPIWPDRPRRVEDVYAVAQVRLLGSETVTIFARNEKRSPPTTPRPIHAEEKLIVKLSAFLIRQRDTGGGLVTGVTVTVWINFSPCFQCSERLVDFIHEMRNNNVDFSRVEIVFPFLYRIRRGYCERHCDTAGGHTLPSERDHARNVQGLRRLRRAGVFLKTFDEAEWRRLGEVLRIPYKVPENRTRDDVNIRQDFLNLMGMP